MSKQRVLITGGSGYIGNYVTKLLAATRPDIDIYSMSRRPVSAQRALDQQTSKFKNVHFVEGDCLKPETYPMQVLGECGAVVHTVGALMEGFDYKKVLKGGIPDLKNPMSIMSSIMNNLQGNS